MPNQSGLVAQIDGRLRLGTPFGIDRTPKGRKEQALIALLIFAPNQEQTRAWLQDKLWSESSPDKASTNFRRALYNLRRALGPESGFLVSDRTSVRFEQPVQIVAAQKEQFGTEVLASLDGIDPEMDIWLRDYRQSSSPGTQLPLQASVPLSQNPRTRLLIKRKLISSANIEHVVSTFLSDKIAEKLTTLGDIDIQVSDGNLELSEFDDQPDMLIEIETLADVEEVLVLLRLRGAPMLSFIWSGRKRIKASLAHTWDQPELLELANQAVKRLVERNATRATTSPFFAIQNAARRLYSGDQAALYSADSMLLNVQKNDFSGVAMAWRSFLRLTEALEFRNTSVSNRESALELADQAIIRSPSNSLVWALAAQVHIKLNDNSDYGLFLARRAVQCVDDDPYALDALSLATYSIGQHDDAFRLARQAQRSAAGLANEYSWDMQCCLSSLSIGRVDEALKYAQDCHQKMPGYRPALRYLTALNLLIGERENADKFALRLQKVEKDFRLEMLAQPSYPVDTLRQLGYLDKLTDIGS